MGGTARSNPPAQSIFVLELPTESRPALVEYRPVEAGLGADVPAGLFDGASGRPGHIRHLQVLDNDHRVFFADGGRSLVQVVPAGVGTSTTPSRQAEDSFAARALHPRPERRGFPRN
jgi:hypothetical protein